MNIYISVDMEGISGVVFPGQCQSGKLDYERFRRLMTAEVNAAVEGALAGGAERIIVNDAHSLQNNIQIEELHPAAELISGVPKPHGMMQGIGPEIDAAFFIGYHAMAGTGTGILAHTLTDQVAEVSLNGLAVGETGLNAALAGAYDVPVVLVTGDQVTIEEARSQLGEIETVTVKRGISQTAARSLHPEVAAEKIKVAAERALKLKAKPFKVALPLRAKVVFKMPFCADMAEHVPGIHRLDGNTVEWTSEDMKSFYSTFQAVVFLPMLQGLIP
jgi:D-amino peptidase